MKRLVDAFLLNQETAPTISRKTGIEQEVIEAWLKYDQSFNLQSKIIVVTILKEKEE